MSENFKIGDRVRFCCDGGFCGEGTIVDTRLNGYHQWLVNISKLNQPNDKRDTHNYWMFTDELSPILGIKDDSEAMEIINRLRVKGYTVDDIKRVWDLVK